MDTDGCVAGALNVTGALNGCVAGALVGCAAGGMSRITSRATAARAVMPAAQLRPCSTASSSVRQSSRMAAGRALMTAAQLAGMMAAKELNDLRVDQ
jgi:hypothetical protein